MPQHTLGGAGGTCVRVNEVLSEAVPMREVVVSQECVHEVRNV